MQIVGFDENENSNSDNFAYRETNIETEVLIKEEEEQKKNKKIKVPNNIQDKGPALAEMVFAAGSIVGPMVGGALYDWHGFDFTTILISICALAFAVLYTMVVFCPGKKLPKNTQSEFKD